MHVWSSAAVFSVTTLSSRNPLQSSLVLLALNICSTAQPPSGSHSAPLPYVCSPRIERSPSKCIPHHGIVREPGRPTLASLSSKHGSLTGASRILGYLQRPPAQPLSPPSRSDPSTSMREFISTLPDEAFRMSGPLIPGYRGILYSKAPPETPEPECWRYVSVSYQLLETGAAPTWGGWRGVIVAFHLPAQEGSGVGRRSQEETLYVGISLKHWCDTTTSAMQLPRSEMAIRGHGRSGSWLPQTVWRNLIVSWTQMGSGSAMYFSDGV